MKVYANLLFTKARWYDKSEKEGDECKLCQQGVSETNDHALLSCNNSICTDLRTKLEEQKEQVLKQNIITLPYPTTEKQNQINNSLKKPTTKKYTIGNNVRQQEHTNESGTHPIKSGSIDNNNSLVTNHPTLN